MCMMSHSWGQSALRGFLWGWCTVSVATGGILLIQQNKALILSSGSKYSIFLSAAPLQEGREDERAGRRERQSSLVWTDCGSWKPVFGGGEVRGWGLLHYSSKEQFETKGMTVRVFPVDGGYVMQWWCSVSCTAAAASQHTTTQWHCLWLQRRHREAGSGETSSRSPGGRLEINK